MKLSFLYAVLAKWSQISVSQINVGIFIAQHVRLLKVAVSFRDVLTEMVLAGLQGRIVQHGDN